MPPTSQDNADFSIQAHLLDIMIVVLWLGTATLLIVSLFVILDEYQLSELLAVYFAFITASYVVRRRGNIDLAAKMIALSLWALGLIAVFTWRAITPATTIVFATAMITLSLLLSKRLSIVLSLLIVAVCTFVFAATELELWPTDLESLSLTEYAMLTAGLLVITVILTNARDNLVEIVQKTRSLASERGTLIEQLQTEIDERKRVEAELFTNQRILNEANRIAKLGSFSMDRGTSTITFSEQAHRILGIEPQMPITSELCLSRFGVDFVARLKRGLDRIVASGYPFEFDQEIVMSDGLHKTLFFSASPVSEGDYFFGIIQDISDRTITEKVLQRLSDELTGTIVDLETEQSLLRAVLNAIPQRVFWKDLEHRYLGCNQLLADDLGFASWKTIIGKTDDELAWSVNAEKFRAQDRGVMETGQPRLNVEEITPEQTWVRTSKVPLRNNSGVTIGILGTYEDITEEKHMEQALRESEAALKMAQEIAKMGSFEFNTITRAIQFSDELYRIFELEPGSEVSVESLTELIGETDYPRLLEYAYDAAETGEAYEVEYEMEFSSGDKKYLYAYSRPIADTQGNLTRVFGAVQDITERKLIEAEREQLAAIVSNSADFIGMANIDATTIYINPGGQAALQYDRPHDYMQQSIRIFHDDATADMLFSEAIPAALSTGKWRGESKLKRRDGTLFDVDQTIFVMRDSTGEAYSMATICRDITEQKRAEQALRESEARYASLVNRARDGVLVIGEERIHFLNSAMASLLGGTVEEIKGQPYGDFLAPESRDLVLGRIVSRLAGEDVPALYEAKFQRQDGTAVDVEISAALVMQDGEPASMGIIRDISERKRSEDALRESEERFRRLFEQLPLGAFLTAARESRQRATVIVDCNEAAARMNGYTREELIGQEIEVLIHNSADYDDAQRLDAWQTMRDQGSMTNEIEYVRKDGTIYPVQVTGTILTIHGEEMLLIIERDVTEARRAEQALRESEERFRTLFEQLPLGAFLFGGHTEESPLSVIVDCNDAAAQMNGYTRDELIGQKAIDLFANADEYKKQPPGQIWQQIRELGNITSDVEHVRKDGSTYPVQATASILHIREQELMLVIARDITDAKRAEQALRESEERFRGLFEQLPLAAFLTAARGEGTRAAIIIDCNEAAARMNGYLRDELIGQPIDLLIANKVPVTEEIRGAFWDQVRNQGWVTLEDDRLRKDGTTYPTQSISSLMEVQGEDMLLIVERDITEAKRAEEALRDSEVRFRRLAEDTPAFVCKFLRDSTLTYVNSTYAAYFGSVPEALVGKPFLTLLPDDEEREKTKSQYLALTCENPTTTYEEQIIGPDGSPLWQQWTDRALCDDDGVITGYQSIGVDITQRKLAESEREILIEELEAKNAELERFTYTVSHDLKSPLITIRGFLGYLESDARQGNFSRMSADIERIGNATVKMERLLNELLQLSRIGRKTNPAEVILFDHVVHEAMEMAQGRLKARKVAVEIMPDAPPLYGDRVRLIEVMQNLIDNAAKFVSDKPKPRIDIGAHVEGEQTRVYVKDNGIGIEPEYQERVFGLFDKLDNNSEGTGVGLALVKRIIEVHGGKIWIESAGKGKGTTFWFTLPNAPA